MSFNVGKSEEDRERDSLSLIFLTVKEKWFAVLVNVVLLIGWGPGTIIANRPILVGGIPMLWLWWVCWFVAWCIGMYLLIFKSGGREFDD